MPKCVKFDSAVKFIRGRPNPRLFDTNGGKIGDCQLYGNKFASGAMANLTKPVRAKFNSNLPNFTGARQTKFKPRRAVTRAFYSQI
ncbi:hypothetical protein [uncultured Campylobacter sp.]|uniref:hypothetical protein n=1 Tax=uncultured Campylobacter sp. TaxID=218934 RepID=UPI0028EF3298|nr:hypothetical protein [uncultured Campylobacter sp.]